jgi:hypothetical protein
VTEAQIEALLARLSAVNAAAKSFDSFPDWNAVTDRTSTTLQYVVAVRLEGALGGGVSIRLITPMTGWDNDVYGQIEVAVPQARSSLRLAPIEWGPKREHRNSANAPADHRFKTLTDRWHPFELNLPLGIRVFQQAEVGVAVMLPRAISTFKDYTALCAELWNCPDANRIPPPPWSRTLI